MAYALRRCGRRLVATGLSRKHRGGKAVARVGHERHALLRLGSHHEPPPGRDLVTVLEQARRLGFDQHDLGGRPPLTASRPCGRYVGRREEAGSPESEDALVDALAGDPRGRGARRARRLGLDQVGGGGQAERGERPDRGVDARQSRVVEGCQGHRKGAARITLPGRGFGACDVRPSYERRDRGRIARCRQGSQFPVRGVEPPTSDVEPRSDDAKPGEGARGRASSERRVGHRSRLVPSAEPQQGVCGIALEEGTERPGRSQPLGLGDPFSSDIQALADTACEIQHRRQVTVGDREAGHVGQLSRDPPRLADELDAVIGLATNDLDPAEHAEGNGFLGPSTHRSRGGQRLRRLRLGRGETTGEEKQARRVRADVGEGDRSAAPAA